MSTREFIYKRRDGTASRSTSLQIVMVAANHRIARNPRDRSAGSERFTLTQDGDAVAEDIRRARVLDALRRRLANGDVGPQYRVRDAAGDIVFVAREVMTAPAPIDTAGNDHADAFWGIVVAEFEQYRPRFAGAYVCKSDSQHAYGNAVDVFFNTFAHQEEVARWAATRADELHIEHVISGDRVWSRGVGWHEYDGEFHSHLHVDFSPSYSGGCGVRG